MAVDGIHGAETTLARGIQSSISYTATVLVWTVLYAISQCIWSVRGAWMRLHRRLVQDVVFRYKRVVGGRSWLFDQEETHTKCGCVHITVAAHLLVTQMVVVELFKSNNNYCWPGQAPESGLEL